MERAYQAGRVLVEGIGAAASRTADGVGRGEGVVAGWRMAWGAVRRSVVKEVAVLERWSVWVYGRAASGGAETEAAKADGDLEEVTRREMMWGPDSALHDEHQGEQETPDDEFQRLPTAAGSGYGEIVSDDEQDPLLMSLHSLAPQPHHHTTEKHRFREALETNMTAEEVSALLVRMRHSEAYGEGDDF